MKSPLHLRGVRHDYCFSREFTVCSECRIWLAAGAQLYGSGGLAAISRRQIPQFIAHASYNGDKNMLVAMWEFLTKKTETPVLHSRYRW